MRPATSWITGRVYGIDGSIVDVRPAGEHRLAAR
jgi:hypothetical protein